MIYRGLFIRHEQGMHLVKLNRDDPPEKALYAAVSEEDAQDWIDAKHKAERSRP